MVGMPSLPVGQNHHPRPQLAQFTNDLDAVLPGVFHPAVWDIEGPAPVDAQDAGRLLSFPTPVLCGTAGAGLALGQVEDRRT